jgi:putative endonuclease
MSFSVYILYSQQFKKLYVGQTHDVVKRLKEHNSRKVLSTKKFIPYEIIHIEEFNTGAEAMKREKFLKSLYSANFKKELLKEFLSTTRQNSKNFE